MKSWEINCIKTTIIKTDELYVIYAKDADEALDIVSNIFEPQSEKIISTDTDYSNWRITEC